MKFFFSFIMILLMFTGCGSQKRMVVAELKPTPSWYTSPPSSNDSTLYATGSGRDAKEAVNDALNTMASMLSISISSSFQSKTTQNQGLTNNYQTTTSSQLQSDVKKIRISNYELIHSYEKGFNEYLVLITTDKKRLFESLKKELDIKFEVIQNRQKYMLSFNALKQLSIYEELQKSLRGIESTILVMSSLKSGFNALTYINKAKELDEKYETLLSKITFSVQSNKDAENLVSTISDGLSDAKFHIAKSKNKEHFVINILANSNKANTYGFTLSRSSINISVRDASGKTIGVNRLNIIGQSTQGYAIAKENVAIKLKAIIEKEGIKKVIGLQE